MALSWRDESDVAVTAPTSLTAAVGTTGASVVRRLYNNFGGAGAPTLAPKRLKLIFRDPGQVYYVGSGQEWADQHYVEGRIVGGLNGLVYTGSTDFKKLGAGSYLEQPAVENAQGVEYEFRLVSPIDAAADTVHVLARLTAAGGVTLSDGLTEASPDGIYLGVRDRGFSVHISGAAAVENSGGADDDVEVGEQIFIVDGTPFTLREDLVNCPAAAAGKTRYDLLSLAADGTMTRTAGVEVTGAVDDEDEPDLPAGELPYARVYVDEFGVIEDDDIEDRREFALYSLTVAGTVATISPGPYSRVDNTFEWTPEEQTANLIDDAVNYIWLRRNGSVEATLLEDRPEDRALLLWVVELASGVVVGSPVDHRFFVGYRSHRIRFHWDGELIAATAGPAAPDPAYRYAVLDSDRDAIINPLAGAFYAVGRIGAGTTDQLRAGLEVLIDGVWTDLFAVDADKPQFPDGATTLIGRFPPDTYVIPRRAQLRAWTDTLPGSSGGDDPSDAELSLEVTL